MEPLFPPVLIRSKAHMNVHNTKPSTGACDICNCCVRLKKCPSCEVSFMCQYCIHHYSICNYCCNANIMFNEYFDDRIEHYRRLQYVNKQIKRLSSSKPPVLFGYNFPCLYNDLRVTRIMWQHKNLFSSIGI